VHEWGRCRTCGHEISAGGTLDGQCPRCLLDLARAAAKAERGRARDRRFGEYLLLRRMGGGPLGVVHEVLADSSGRRLALKRWGAEPSRDGGPGGPKPWPPAALRHPGVVTLHAHGQRGNTAWIAMDLMAGGSLRGWIADAAARTRAPAAIEVVVRLLADAALTLDHLHRNGVVHAGIKPENLLFVGDGRRLLLSDFAPANGAAIAAVSWLGAHGNDTRYLAPEQVREADTTGPPTDVYALAVCLVEALILADKPRPLDVSEAMHMIPPRLRRVLQSCLDADPRRRPAAAEMGRALLDGLDLPPADEVGLLSRARRLWRRR
jgi:serine/threonine protein kinase